MGNTASAPVTTSPVQKAGTPAPPNKPKKPKSCRDRRSNEEDQNQYENLPDLDAPENEAPAAAGAAAKPSGTTVGAKSSDANAGAWSPGGLVSGIWGWATSSMPAAPSLAEKKPSQPQVAKEEKKPPAIRAPEDRNAKADWQNDNYRTLNMVPDNDKVFARKSPSTPTTAPKTQPPPTAGNQLPVIRPPEDRNAKADYKNDNYRTLNIVGDNIFQRKSPSTPPPPTSPATPPAPKPPTQQRAMAPQNDDNYRTLAGIADPFQKK